MAISHEEGAADVLRTHELFDVPSRTRPSLTNMMHQNQSIHSCSKASTESEYSPVGSHARNTPYLALDCEHCTPESMQIALEIAATCCTLEMHTGHPPLCAPAHLHIGAVCTE